MKKLSALMGFACFMLTACSDYVNDIQVEEIDLTKTLITDQNQLNQRLFVNTGFTPTSGSRAGQGEVAPEIPGDAINLVDAYETFYAKQCSEWYKPDRNYVYLPLESGKSYYVPEGSTFSGCLNLNDVDNISVYVAGTWNVANVQGNPSMNVYVLSKGTLNWGLHTWQAGQLIIGSGKAEIVKCWGTINSYFKGEVTELTNVQVNAKSKLYLFSGDMEELYIAKNGNNGGGNLFVETGSYFYSEIPVTLCSSLELTNGGDMHFANTFLCLGDLYLNSGSNILFEKCSTISGNTTFSGGNTNIYISEGLKTENLSIDGSKLYLNSSLLDVSGTTTMYATGNEGVIKGEEGKYRSILRTGELVLNAYQSTNRNITTLKGNLDVLADKINGSGESLDADKLAATQINEGVVFNSSKYYLPATDCRAQIGTKEEPDLELVEIIGILPPSGSHPFSATSFSFNEDENILYLGWHANQKWETEWGGYMDVIKVDAYNPEGTLFAQTWRSQEMRFNHTLYYNGMVYGAGTSNKVGAALFELPVNADGMFDEDIDSTYTRVNLTGESANCVELVGKDFVTISGWGHGAINTFPCTSREKKPANTYFEGAYKGKYVYLHKNYLVTLHDTDKGIVEVYDVQSDVNTALSGSPILTFEAGALEPQDGKNVCICDDDYIYVCRGNNKLAVFDFTGKKVAETTASANGVDVDEEFIYLASGNGLKIYNKSDINGSETVTLAPIAKFKMTEATTIQEPSTSIIGQSSNYIKKGKDGRLYVAYGIYGLRIYEIVKK